MALDPLAPLPEDRAALRDGLHSDPHAVLGVHEQGGTFLLRARHPDARSASVCIDGRWRRLRTLGDGLFGIVLAEAPGDYVLRFRFESGEFELRDPFRYGPTVGELDLHLFGEGRHLRLHDVLGAHPRIVDGVAGVAFAVWAPAARAVRVVGDFCRWDGRLFPMRNLGGPGVWELFVPGLGAGERYKFEVLGADGSIVQRADPFARRTEVPPATASMVHVGKHEFRDAEWLDARSRRDPVREPIFVYEVHSGSIVRGGGPDGVAAWDHVADAVLERCGRVGATHVELLPVMEHPFYGSWGYQVTSFFAPTARHGEPDGLARLVDRLHERGIGVLLDFVPAHFPTDAWALARFDGAPLFEHGDPRKGFHPDWNTAIFDYGRPEVRNFLVASALFWLDAFHADGLRVDAVASMLYLDYSRKPGEWVPNEQGGRENLDAVRFLRELNEAVRTQHPGAIMIAEESTAWEGVTREDGLGFTFKWNMGWMHDTLAYLREDPLWRCHHHHKLTFAMMYERAEHFVNALSHDEIVHGKGTLLSRMPGDPWQRRANVRLLFAYLLTRPGKKHLFAGMELLTEHEWDHDRGFDFRQEPRAEVDLLAELARLYRERAALHAGDGDEDRGFQWVDADDVKDNVYSYERRAGDDVLLVVLNSVPEPRIGKRFGVSRAGRWRVLVDTDAKHFGGSGWRGTADAKAERVPAQGRAHSLVLDLPPLSALILEPIGRRRR